MCIQNCNLCDIYIARNIITHKSYIGQTKHWYKKGNGFILNGWKSRCNDHVTHPFKETQHRECPKFYKAIRKYGVESFVFKRIETCHIDDVDNRERHWIRIFNSVEKGYNISPGGKIWCNYEKLSETNQTLWDTKEFRDNQLSMRERTIDLPHNIYEHRTEKDNILTGYRVNTTRYNRHYSKTFTLTNYHTISQCLELAIQWRDMITVECTNKDPHKELEDRKAKWLAPEAYCKEPNEKYVNRKFESGIQVGYQVYIRKYGSVFSKVFGKSIKGDLDMKMELAVKWRDNVLNILDSESNQSIAIQKAKEWIKLNNKVKQG